MTTPLDPGITIPDLIKISRDPNYVWLAVMVSRPGAQWFMRHLELKFYRPETPRNRLLDMILLKWPDDMPMLWAICRIPMSEKQNLYDAAKATGMRVGDGIPQMFGGNGIEKFPLDGPNVFTLENSRESILYSGGEEDIKRIEKEQIRLLDMELLSQLRAEGICGPDENPFLDDDENTRRVQEWEERSTTPTLKHRGL
jgi:hypothetical protein